jgi:23S rRNA (uridine2552-2'-O)-methyltransferase
VSYNRKDAFHQRAKREGFRSRAAYKLEEIQRTRRLLRKGQRVLDLGCWPGGWLQVASSIVGERGRVVGIDCAEVSPPFAEPQIETLVGDLGEAETAAALLRALGGPAHVVLSDAAPKTTGVRATDRAREEALLLAVSNLVPDVLAEQGDLLMKLLDCPEAQQVRESLRPRFESCKVFSVRASRKGSAERYLLARGFRGAS